MIRHLPLLPIALALATLPVHATGLPDTGQDTCYNDTVADSTAASDPASIARDGGTHPRQDCRYGRDAAAAASAQPKAGAGAKGFDYSKIANNGTALAATAPLGTAATDWACTRDNITGLTWEIKTATATDLHYTAHTYTWYNSDGNTNGGNAGGMGTNTCRAMLPGSQCNTQAFVAAVNAKALCSYTDWRLPSLRELRTLNHFGRLAPSLDITYFPNTRTYGHWSSTHIAETYATTAWVVGTNVGGTFGGNKTDDYDVRLVRGGPVAGTASCTAGNPNPAVVEATPTSAFTSHGDGTATHQLTGLMWKQCAQGASGTACTATAPMVFTWRAALAAAAAETTAGYRDWRLPNQRELESIVEPCGREPAINQSVFPGTPSVEFWSGTTRVSPTSAWYAEFRSGSSSSGSKTESRYARLVRGGQRADTTDAQTVRPGVVEYLDTADFPNSPGGHFFYTSEAAEQAAVDAGAAGNFVRTGRLFLTGGTAAVCRFYGSMTPGPNSHFFTVDAAECNALIAAQVTPTPTTVQQWNYEGLPYSTTPANVAANGTRSCPPHTLPLYRAYNNAYPPSGPKNAWDSNHRFTPSLADIAEMVAAGWRDEGLVFCTVE